MSRNPVGHDSVLTEITPTGGGRKCNLTGKITEDLSRRFYRKRDGIQSAHGAY